MKNIILVLFLSTCFFNFPAFGQQKDTTQMEEVFSHPEIIPHFEGGWDSFYKIITENIRFTNDMIEGKLFIQCTIDTLGKMKNIKVARGLSETNDKEALRLMELINQNYNWKSGLLMGKKQEMRMNFPIVFRKENTIIQNNEKFKVIVTEDIPKKEDLFTEQDTSEIVMSACFNQGVQIDYIEIERDTNNQEYLIYNVVEKPPIFEGGIDNFYKIVGKNLKLVENQSETGTRVLIEFVIDTTGKMTDFKILKSNFSEKNNAGFLQTLDWINQNYTWQPAIHEEKKVFFRMNLPIIIRLE